MPYAALLLLVASLLAASAGVAQPAERLSDRASVSLLTMRPGDEVYSVFGHSAFRITDPSLGLDRTYNFGTFDFDQPFFVVRFARGQLDYILDAVPYAYELSKYRYLRRPVIEQRLAFPPEAVRALYRMLETNRLPENRAYRYDFFFDNCSTRLLATLDKALTEAGYPPITLANTPRDKTFRELLQPYLDAHPLTDLGTDLGLGLPTDRVATPREATFLPDGLMYALDRATIDGHPLVRETRTAVAVPGYHIERDVVRWPQWLAALAFLLGSVATVRGRRRGASRLGRLGDTLLFGLAGIAGIVLSFLWLGTQHTVTGPNLNVLWAWPSHLIAAWWLRKPMLSLGVQRYLIVAGVATLVTALAWPFLPQVLPGPVYPVVLLLALRALARAVRNPLHPVVSDPPMASSSAITDMVLVGNGRPPALPPRLSPTRIRTLATLATYGDDASDRALLAVHTPFTGETVMSLSAATPSDVEHACARARAAQTEWAALPFAARARVVARFHDLVLEQHAEALDLITLESGKTRFDAFLEVADVASVSRYYTYHGDQALASSYAAGAIPLFTQTRVHHTPVGLVGVIAPWNYPLTMAITDAIPALLAGNAVVLKPAEQTPLSALWAAERLYEAGLPRDLFHVVPGDGATLGPTLIAETDFVHFTGSTETGRLVAQQAAEALTGCSLELGGKNPFIVLDDADLELATDGALRACFSSAGQLCIAAERIYIHRSLFDAFAERLVEKIEAMVIAPSYGWDVDMGSLVSQEQFDKVTAHVGDAVERGAHVLTGGHPLPEHGPYFYAPTVLTNVTPEATLFDEETFGPVVSLYAFDTNPEAVRLANSSPYGLHASVWTRNTRRGTRLARRLEAGTVTVNDPFMAAWGSTAAPMGGVKQSGQGRRHGPEGILKYTEAQTVATQHLIPIAPPGGVALEAFANASLAALRLVRRLPGLR